VQEVAGLQIEAQNLQAAASSLRMKPVSPGQKAEWAVIKDLVDRRAFSWSELFADLEDVLPGDVRIVNVSPRVKDGRSYIELRTKMQSIGAGIAFAKKLDQAPMFKGVVPLDCTQSLGSIDCSYGMYYVSRALVAGDAPPAAGPVAALQASRKGGR
jgi:hypothetical protein